ncbi:hypothetical protein RIF29_16133 [Crotalaria pallida]|uniref:MULE transposase domain-containing protein n=1 Tax=Crotalaria pallida TaxID=3830 RepID=A0AAN9FEU3_CROPI
MIHHTCWDSDNHASLQLTNLPPCHVLLCRSPKVKQVNGNFSHRTFEFCKPIIQIDGTFLYGKYRGTLLIATSQDGNSKVVPLAFAIVEGETLSAWSWFLANIREHVTSKTGICLISDRHKSIIQAVANEHLGWQPPNAYHVYCIRHISSNFNLRFKNSELKGELISLGYIPGEIHFDNVFGQFKSESANIERWIDRIPKEKWSLAYDGGRRSEGHNRKRCPLRPGGSGSQPNDGDNV